MSNFKKNISSNDNNLDQINEGLSVLARIVARHLEKETSFEYGNANLTEPAIKPENVKGADYVEK